ncbi:MAG TPA: DUF3043 domain-containing protein, partial [Jatrophihabitans sp.]
MSLLRKPSSAPEPTPEPVVEPVAGKGRATPKRRDTAPKRQPMTAPRTSKEAAQLRKQQATQTRNAPAAAKMGTREYREALKRGDESVLSRRDTGPVRRLARNWVDTHHLASNYLLLVFPLLLFAGSIPDHLGTYFTIGLVVIFAVEWLWVGRRIHALAVSRFDQVTEKPWVLGLYAGQRAFLPRKWRSPGATVRR